MRLPVLLLTFNRPNETEMMIKKLSFMKPTKLYISQDGPRKNHQLDEDLCSEVKKVFKTINWDCEVFYKINDNNLGCRETVSKAINWFFSNEEKGIILEDDCLPSNSFFLFCEKMLDKYENSTEVYVVSGSNFQNNNKIGNADYYFSKYAHCWGWATWKRAWLCYDNSMKFWEKLKKSKHWKNLHPSSLEKKYWERIFDDVKNNRIDSWAYVWLASIWNSKGVTITPNINLVINIGFNKDATNTLYSSNTNFKKLTFQEFKNKISDPQEIKVNNFADNFVFQNHFNGKYNFWPWRAIYILKMLINDPKTFYLRVKKYIL